MTTVFPIVEGHGEVQAVPTLLRRIFHDVIGRYDLHCLKPHRLPRTKLVGDPMELTKAVDLGARKIRSRGRPGLVLVLMDADDDCPAAIGPRLLGEASPITQPDVSVSVVLANREYESWFLAAARSLRHDRRIRDDAEPPRDPEAIRGAKEALARTVLAPNTTYSPAVDQPALTALMDLVEARRTASFDKLCRDLEAFVAALD